MCSSKLASNSHCVCPHVVIKRAVARTFEHLSFFSKISRKCVDLAELEEERSRVQHAFTRMFVYCVVDGTTTVECRSRAPVRVFSKLRDSGSTVPLLRRESV